MFEISYTPGWAYTILILAAIVIFIISLIIMLSSEMSGLSFLLALAISIISAMLGFLIIILTAPTMETDNPHAKSQNSINEFVVQEDKVSEKIEQVTKTDFDKISLEGTEKELGNKIMNDKIVDFTALKDEEKLEGSFYFEKGKMNITLNEDTEKVKTYSVSVK